MNDPLRSAPDLIAKLLGALLMAVGGLIAVLSGLCSLAFLGSTLQHSSQSGQIIGVLVSALLFGGIPVSVGVGLFSIGRRLFRG